MPWRDLDAPATRALELWSFVTDTRERINSVARLLRFIAAPGRFVDHPPARNLDAWDRICAQRRCVALGGVDAHQIGIRVGGRVPLRLMAYKRSFRFLRTHLLVERPLRASWSRTASRVFAALRAGHAYIAMDSLAPAKRIPVLGARATHRWHGRRGAAAGDWRSRARCRERARVRLVRDGAEVAAAARRRASSTKPGAGRLQRRGIPARRTGASAPGSSRTRSTCAKRKRR